MEVEDIYFNNIREGVVVKNIILVFSSILSVMLLSGCGAKDISEYIDVSFQGYNTFGTVTATLNDSFYSENGVNKYVNDLNGINIEFDKEDNLSNGDEIKVTTVVDAEEMKEKKIPVKQGEKTVTVEGLEEPEVLTNQEVEDNLVLNYLGVSGTGTTQIDNLFSEPLDNVNFEVSNDGTLTNGDMATIAISKEDESLLNDQGYILDEDFAPSFEVSGLNVVAGSVIEIANLGDIERMINEEVNRQFATSGSYKSYEVNFDKFMYRQFKKETKEDEAAHYDSVDSTQTDGNLIGIYTINKYLDGELSDTETAIIGYGNMYLDENNNVNVSEIEKIFHEKDSTYSLESVYKLYEGYGYTDIE